MASNKKSLFQRMIDQSKTSMKMRQEEELEERQEKREEKQYQKDRIKQLGRDHIPYCPKCKSTNIQFIENRKGLGLGIGITRSVGVAVGSSKATKKGMMKCLNCGHTWKL